MKRGNSHSQFRNSASLTPSLAGTTAAIGPKESWICDTILASGRNPSSRNWQVLHGIGHFGQVPRRPFAQHPLIRLAISSAGFQFEHEP